MKQNMNSLQMSCPAFRRQDHCISSLTIVGVLYNTIALTATVGLDIGALWWHTGSIDLPQTAMSQTTHSANKNKSNSFVLQFLPIQLILYICKTKSTEGCTKDSSCPSTHKWQQCHSWCQSISVKHRPQGKHRASTTESHLHGTVG